MADNSPRQFDNAGTGSQRAVGGSPRRRRRKIRLLPVCIFGLLVAIVFALLLMLLYTGYCYLASKNGNVSVIAPTVIYFLVIFAGSFAATAVINGRSLVPAGLVGLCFFCYSIGYSASVFGWAEMKLSMILIKLLLSVVAAFLGYFLAGIRNSAGHRRRTR